VLDARVLALTFPSPRRIIVCVVGDHELIAQKLSVLNERVDRLENRLSDLLIRVADIEKALVGLEAAAIETARAFEQISTHWDKVYKAMRRPG
jgi:uncharacterized coiled-coil protein SlyX